MATLTGISPVLLVADLDRSVAFYRDQLGFECRRYGDPPHFASASRDAATFLLALAAAAERPAARSLVVHGNVRASSSAYRTA